MEADNNTLDLYKQVRQSKIPGIIMSLSTDASKIILEKTAEHG